MTWEARFCEIRQEGARRIAGVGIPYGETAELPFGRERFEAGAFGDVSAADVILNRQHERGTPLARTGGGGLVLSDGPDALRFAATLPETRDADDTLILVKSGVLRGASVEFRAIAERLESGVRVIERAALGGIGIVDKPAYAAATVEARRRGRGGGGWGGGYRRMARAYVPYNRKLACRCVKPSCEVRFGRIKVETDEDIVATSAGFDSAFASTKAGSLRLKQAKGGLEIELSDRALETEAGRRMLEQSKAGVAVFARPVVDYERTAFTEKGGVREVAEARINAILLKPIAGDEAAREGWTPVEFTAAAEAPRRRFKSWLL